MKAFQFVSLVLLIAAALLAGLALSLRKEDTANVEAKCKGRCLTLHGSKAADHLLGFSVLYLTGSGADDCTARDRGGARIPLRKLTHFTVKGDGERFSVDIPLDTYAGGRCEWRPDAMYFDVTSVRNQGAMVKGGRTLLLFTGGNTYLRAMNFACKRATIQVEKKKAEVHYGCFESSGIPLLRLGDGSHTVEANFR